MEAKKAVQSLLKNKEPVTSSRELVEQQMQDLLEDEEAVKAFLEDEE